MKIRRALPKSIQEKLQKIDPDVSTLIMVLFDKVEELSQKKPFLTINEAAEYLGCQRTKIYVMMNTGELAYSRPNDKGSGRAYFRREDLDAYLSRNYHPSQADIDAQAANYIAKAGM